ncbi:MAG TPA: nitrilase-related carbon-nitrogen hydrolase [Verrucomicrobiae bacterium]|nr:nitrilase-related carbon-nitrogen hydrolase [Verrucomicrobiae bacterium]
MLAVVCFHLAYTSIKFPALGLFIFGYAYFLVQLTHQPTIRRAFYFGLATGFLCDAPQLFFFWKIFSVAAIVLWLIAGFWIGLFTAISCGCILRWGKAKTMWLIPIIWTGLEYFRSELYYLKFSWLNVGYALPIGSAIFGMYGVGFFVFAIIIVIYYWRAFKVTWFETIIILGILFIVLALYLSTLAKSKWKMSQPITLVGIQMEFPPENAIPKMLNNALTKNTNAPIFVLSEYTLDGGVPDSLKNWCREHSRFLIVGGKDVVTNDVYYNTAFVVGTNGEMIFKQAKCVPIQFFKDGLPAPKQEIWNSPFGKIGICICYDLSYTRVTDELVRQGTQLLVVPTMDVEEWGRHEHELHSRVAPVRAMEYGIPIFRVASSGVSQAVSSDGSVVAKTSIGGNGDIFSAQLRLPLRGPLPLDRFFAPICTAMTAIVLMLLLLSAWRNHRAIQPPPTTKSS